MASAKNVTNRTIIDRVDSVRIELKDDIIRLENKFDVLAANRITRLENKVNEMEIAQAKKDAKIQETQATLSTKFVIIGALALAIIYGLADALARKFIK